MSLSARPWRWSALPELELGGRPASASWSPESSAGRSGVERELREHDAGLRTHTLVAVGSALFTIVSAYAWTDFNFSSRDGITYDPTRIAAQIVTGIGFLGAGAIIRQGLSVRGLTTAASLWVVAAIGMASGAGYYSGAVITTIVVLRQPLAAADRGPQALRAHPARRAPARGGAAREREPVGPPRAARIPRRFRAGVRGRGCPRPPPRRARRARREHTARSGHRRADAPRASARGAVGELIRAVLASANENKLRELDHALDGWSLELLDTRGLSARERRDLSRECARQGRVRADARAGSLGARRGLRASRSRGSAAARACCSARWAAGREAERALEELEACEGDGRRARYVCELVAISPDGAEHRGTGVLEGRIAEELSGSEGFGFDPVFIPDGRRPNGRAARQRLEAATTRTEHAPPARCLPR